MVKDQLKPAFLLQPGVQGVRRDAVPGSGQSNVVQALRQVAHFEQVVLAKNFNEDGRQDDGEEYSPAPKRRQISLAATLELNVIYVARPEVEFDDEIDIKSEAEMEVEPETKSETQAEIKAEPYIKVKAKIKPEVKIGL